MAYWVCCGFTVISACVSLGYSVAALRADEEHRHVTVEYAFVRSLALTLTAFVALFGVRHDWLVAVASAMILVQGLDALVGARIPDRVKTFGPAVTAAVNAALLLWYVSA